MPDNREIELGDGTVVRVYENTLPKRPRDPNGFTFLVSSVIMDHIEAHPEVREAILKQRAQFARVNELGEMETK